MKILFTAFCFIISDVTKLIFSTNHVDHIKDMRKCHDVLHKADYNSIFMKFQPTCEDFFSMTQRHEINQILRSMSKKNI